CCAFTVPPPAAPCPLCLHDALPTSARPPRSWARSSARPPRGPVRPPRSPRPGTADRSHPAETARSPRTRRWVRTVHRADPVPIRSVVAATCSLPAPSATPSPLFRHDHVRFEPAARPSHASARWASAECPAGSFPVTIRPNVTRWASSAAGSHPSGSAPPGEALPVEGLSGGTLRGADLVEVRGDPSPVTREAGAQDQGQVHLLDFLD